MLQRLGKLLLLWHIMDCTMLHWGITLVSLAREHSGLSPSIRYFNTVQVLYNLCGSGFICDVQWQSASTTAQPAEIGSQHCSPGRFSIVHLTKMMTMHHVMLLSWLHVCQCVLASLLGLLLTCFAAAAEAEAAAEAAEAEAEADASTTQCVINHCIIRPALRQGRSNGLLFPWYGILIYVYD